MAGSLVQSRHRPPFIFMFLRQYAGIRTLQAGSLVRRLHDVPVAFLNKVTLKNNQCASLYNKTGLS